MKTQSMMPIAQALLCTITLLGAGCFLLPPAPPTVRYYRLMPTVPDQPAQIGTNAPPSPRTMRPTVLVARPQLASYLTRPNIVIRSSNTSINFSDGHRWSEPLQQAIQRLLRHALQQALPDHDVVALPCLFSPADAVEVCLIIDEFEISPQGTAVAAGRWILIDYPEQQRRMIRSFRITRTFTYRADDLSAAVAALSTTIEELAGQIARSMIIPQT